jgi:hypothetical protein
LPDSRTHRGPDPRDSEAFGPLELPSLRSGVEHLSWLLSRGYAPRSALKLVGDRWSLTERQRMAVLRCSCSDESRAKRGRLLRPIEEVRGRPVVIDGFNALTTVEAALGGAAVLLARDGCLRDVAGLHGSYRQVEETLPAIVLIGEILADRGAGPCLWCLDRPVSNSGRLAGAIREAAEARDWDWSVELMFHPDAHLSASAEIIATADGVILDRCARWVNLAREAVGARAPGAWRIDLSGV